MMYIMLNFISVPLDVMYIILKASATAFSPSQPFLQLKISLSSSRTVPPQSVSPTIQNIHGPYFCMNSQDNKLFPQKPILTMLHLINLHSPPPLNNMLILHNMTTQDQQLPCLLRQYLVALHTNIFATL